MKRRKSNSSSLEMLLDTMCNTFGAVVFLCLTLVVLLSARTSLPPPETAAPDEAELTRLQEEYAALADQLTLLVRTRHLNVDAAAVMRLELSCTERKLALKKIRHEILTTRLQQANVQKDAAAAGARSVRQEEDLQRLNQEEAALEAALQKLADDNRNAARVQDLNFSRREASRQNPYYLILTPTGTLHRLGMERSGGELLPHGEVEYQRSGTLFSCAAKAGSGRPLLLADGTLNPELWPLFLELEQLGRPPYFLIAKESAAAFFQLRFELKKRQIRFGWMPLPETGRVAVEVTRAPVRWEYAQ